MKLQQKQVAMIFALLYIFGQTGQNVSLRVFADLVGAAGGVPYFVVWFCSFGFVVLFGLALAVMRLTTDLIGETELEMLSWQGQRGPLLIGLADAINGMMVVFASPSARTPPYLQATLGNFTIPITICVRYVLLKKSPHFFQYCACALVVVALFIACLPELDGKGEGGMFWPTWFMLGFVPAALMNVIEEDVLHKQVARALRVVNMVWFVFWLNFWQLVFVTAFFFVDFIPGYGMSTGPGSLWTHMLNGFHCVFSEPKAFCWGFVFIGSYMVAYIFGGFLLRVSEGATWGAMVAAAVTPFCMLWWTVFQWDKPTAELPLGSFYFGPQWTFDTTCAFLSLLPMVPGIYVYNRAVTAKEAESRAQSLVSAV